MFKDKLHCTQQGQVKSRTTEKQIF